MKAVRASLLTMLLLAGATSQPVPTTNLISHEATVTVPTAGPCYLVNGIWICDP